MADYTFGFIGTGNMGSALAKAAVKHIAPEKIILSNRTAAKAEALAAELGCAAGDSAAVPDLSGLPLDEAVTLLAERGLFVRRSSAGSGGVVSAQSIPAGSTAEQGSVIEVTLTDDGELGRY